MEWSVAGWSQCQPAREIECVFLVKKGYNNYFKITFSVKARLLTASNSLFPTGQHNRNTKTLPLHN